MIGASFAVNIPNPWETSTPDSSCSNKEAQQIKKNRHKIDKQTHQITCVFLNVCLCLECEGNKGEEFDEWHNKNQKRKSWGFMFFAEIILFQLNNMCGFDQCTFHKSLFGWKEEKCWNLQEANVKRTCFVVQWVCVVTIPVFLKRLSTNTTQTHKSRTILGHSCFNKIFSESSRFQKLKCQLHKKEQRTRKSRIFLCVCVWIGNQFAFALTQRAILHSLQLWVFWLQEQVWSHLNDKEKEQMIWKLQCSLNSHIQQLLFLFCFNKNFLTFFFHWSHTHTKKKRDSSNTVLSGLRSKISSARTARPKTQIQIKQ